MIDVVEIYKDVAIDNANTVENGTLSYTKFNRKSWRAELRMLDWLTGHTKKLEGSLPPANQKNRDFIAPFLVDYPQQIVNGKITLPSNYYMWDHAYRITGLTAADCDEETEDGEELANIPIEILTAEQFDKRATSYIEEKKPSFKKPIAKIVGKQMIFAPADLGSITLVYVKYPTRAKIVTMLDTAYNEDVPDPALCVNYEWDEFARELLVWFITDMYANHTSNAAMKQMNDASNPKKP